MLDVSRIINGKLRIEKEPVQAAAVIDGAVATVAPLAASKHIALEHREVDRDVWVDGDPDRLQQIVWNLLNNAIKFTPDGGGVAVRLARESSYARIDVLDTGSGIALDFLPHVFERFRQGDAASTRRVGGLGLGLSIVKSLVELHGGTVDVASDGPGHGATFRVWLPVRAVKPERAAVISMARPTAVHEHSLRGVRCLVVDDEASAREVIAATLAGHGADVSTAVDVPAGVESFLRLRPHVLVSDIAMPGATGHDLVRRIRALSGDEGKDTPALALTAYASVQDRHDALDAGFDWHLSKPVEPAELVAVVMELAGRGKTRAAR
jgi:CheY-like chemotaxis protein